MADLDVAEVEKFLFKLDESAIKIGSTDYLIQLDIIDLGCWIIKLRKTGIYINNADLVYVDLMNISATISFKSNSYFWQVINGGFDFEDEILKTNIKQSGNTIALEMFRKLCIKPFDSQLQQFNTNISATVPVRAGRVHSADGQQPLKAGFLLKKRDILAGWRCRYFVVYPGRLEYYVDQHDIHSRATISLVGAEITPAKRTTVNGVGEHWGLLVKTKNPDKTFRLASEMSGMEGMVETTTWEQVFNIATKLTLEPNPSAASSPRVNETSRGKKSILPLLGNNKSSAATTPAGSSSSAHTSSSTAGVSSSSGAVRTAVTAAGGGGGGDSSLLIQAGIILVLLLVTFYVYEYSTVQNKAVYIALSVVLTSVLVGILVTQLQARSGATSNRSSPQTPVRTTANTPHTASTAAESVPSSGAATPVIPASSSTAPVTPGASAVPLPAAPVSSPILTSRAHATATAATPVTATSEDSKPQHVTHSNVSHKKKE